jgi:hypothetical protein
LHELEVSIGKEKRLNLKKSDASCSKAVHFRAKKSASGGCLALNNAEDGSPRFALWVKSDEK